MILGFIPDMVIGGAAFGIGRAYGKPWLSILGGVYMLGTVVHTGLVVVAIAGAAKK
jgi:hypothetical protein